MGFYAIIVNFFLTFYMKPSIVLTIRVACCCLSICHDFALDGGSEGQPRDGLGKNSDIPGEDAGI